MRSRALAFLIAVGAMIAIVLFAIVVLDDEPTEESDDTAAASPSATTQPPPTATPTPEAQEPTFAPDGRTGISELDRIIDDFVTLDAEALAKAYADVSLRDLTETADQLAPAPEWAARLSEAERSLYAATRDRPGSGAVPPRDYDIVLSVTEPGRETTGWRIAVQHDAVVEFVTSSLGASPPAAYAPEVGFNYDLFLVLPPRDELPQPPASHALDTPTGDAGVDAIVELIAAHDADGLLTLADTPLSSGECGRNHTEDDTEARASLRTIAEQAIALHAVAVVPEGHLTQSDHVIILVLQPSPYRWYTGGVLERDGRIVAADFCESNSPEILYPPLSYPLPPVAGLDDLDPSRRADIEVIDSFLDALRAADFDAMLDLVSYQQIGCIVEPVGIGGPPFCLDGEAEGTLVEVVPSGQCEGFYARKDELRSGLEQIAGKPWSIYAIVDPGQAEDGDRLFFLATWQTVLSDPEATGDSFYRSIALWFDEAGLAGISYGCGPVDPDNQMNPGISPDFLLPPP